MVTGEVILEQFIGGRREKDDTLRLTLAVGEILQENGIEVLYTRTTDVYLSPYERAVEANQAGVDFSCRSIETLIRQIMK